MYTTLDPDKEEIRLLRVEPSVEHNAQVSCEIAIAQLQDQSSPDYAALSYVWGDATDTEEIFVNGQSFQATKSLASALRQFRSSYITAMVDSGPSLIWADAVCINQQNLTERGQQVAMMGSIYAKASFVISWLGPSDDSTESGFKLIKACAAHVEDTRKHKGEYPESDVAMDASDLAFLSERSEFHEQTHARYARNKAWNAIDDLNENVYWTRIWIIQEVVLARQPDLNILYCGGHSVTFQQLSDFNLFAERLQEQKPLKPPFFDQRVWDWVIKDSRLTSPFIQQTKALRDSRVRGDYRFVMLISTICRSTDPRDVVFGLSGILGNEIAPNYTMEAADVFRECVAAILRQKKCKHLFHNAGLLREGRDISEFPSWVPRFHTLKEDANYHIGAPDVVVAPWLDELCPEGPVILDRRTMRFSGVRLDRCTRVLRHAGSSQAEYPETLRRFWWLCLRFVEEYGGEYPRYGRRCLEDLLHALGKGKDTRGQPLRITPSVHCIAAHAFRFLLRIGEPEDDGDEGDAAGQKWSHSRYANLEEARTALDDAFVGPEAPDVSTLGSTLSERENEDCFNAMNALIQTVFNWINWPLFRTAKGHMGLAPPAIAEGDLVCLLEGFSIPCLLRRHDQDHYVLVGSCYVTGYSKGEPLESLRKGDLSLEPFYLR
ncbi:heterokaryon incompatibility protein-domain-containing protein [Apiospora saccharicola]|uniref:Heterokaryon incompatibility protein-domain-containing protein n=1 Tax=Apiospora saccharicola TaxID=335842 RepID=A0ABR1W3N2_9PEZI